MRWVVLFVCLASIAPATTQCCGLISWAEQGACWCADQVSYRTMQACNVANTCELVDRDRAIAQELYGGGNMTAECTNAVKSALCAYHFWKCLDDKVVYNEVCEGTCSGLSACGEGAKLSDFTLGKFFHKGCQGNTARCTGVSSLVSPSPVLIITALAVFFAASLSQTELV